MTANWRNRTLFHGNNLAFLRAMQLRKGIMGAVCAAMLAAAPQQGIASPIDGELLLKLATSGQERHETSYIMYVAGVADGLMFLTEALRTDDLFCVSNVTLEDMANAVRIWMRNNTDMLKADAAVVTFTALSQHFPCD